MRIEELKCHINGLDYRNALVAPKRIDQLLTIQLLLKQDAAGAIDNLERAFPAQNRLPSQKVSLYLAMGLGAVGVLSFYWHGATLLRRLSAISEWDVWPLDKLPHHFWLKAAVRTGIPLGLACVFGKLNQRKALPELIGELKTHLKQGE